MDNYKLRIKIGNNEFEAVGDKETVMLQFEEFKDMVKLHPSQHERLNLAFHHDSDNQIVSLKITPPKDKGHIADAVLMVMLGYSKFRNQDNVLATQLQASLRQSGIIATALNKTLIKTIDEDLLRISGIKKARKYRLTNRGKEKARNLIQETLEQVI